MAPTGPRAGGALLAVGAASGTSSCGQEATGADFDPATKSATNGHGGIPAHDPTPSWTSPRGSPVTGAARLVEVPYVASLSLAELGRAQSALPAIRDFETRNPTRVADFVAAARNLLEGDLVASRAAVDRVLASDFRDPEGLYCLTRRLAHLGDVGAALDLLWRVIDGGWLCYPAIAANHWLEAPRREKRAAAVFRKARTEHEKGREEFEKSDGAAVLHAGK